MTGFRSLVVLSCAALFVACGGEEPPASVEEDVQATVGGEAQPAGSPVGEIQRFDPRVDALIPADATIEKLADGFNFIEGPVWDRQNSRLLFSDVRGNEIYEWSEAAGATTFIDPVFEGDRTGKGSISSNGLVVGCSGDRLGRLQCQISDCLRSGTFIKRGPPSFQPYQIGSYWVW